MTRVLLVISLLLPSVAAAAQTTAFVNVNVIPMDSETVLSARTVIVHNDRITAIGAVDDTVLPDDAVIVDGTDRYLLPGLVEMHGHVTGTSNDELTQLFALYLANGVTTIRGMLGRPSHLELRDALAAGERLGPRLITSGPSFNGNSVNGVEQARRMVVAQKAAGYDFLKIHPGLSLAEFQAIAATANEVGIPFAGHVPAAAGVQVAFDSGMATIDHLDGYMQSLLDEPVGPDEAGFFGLMLAGEARESRIDAVVAATLAAGTWNVPTQTLFEFTANAFPADDFADRAEMKYVETATLNFWVASKATLLADPEFDRAVADRAIELRRVLIKRLHDAGAGLLLGSDSPQRFNVPGFSLHRELSLMVAAGLTPYEALRTGTVNPTVFFAEADSRGTIEPGKIADLVLLDDNPLETIGNSARVHGTMLGGRWLSRTQLDDMLEQAERR